MHAVPPHNIARSPRLASLRTRVRKCWPECLVTLTLVVSQLWDVLLAGPQRVLANPDVQLHYWTIWWWATALRTHPLLVWDAPQFVPYPASLAFSDHLAPLGIVAAPLVWVGVPIALILHAAVVGSAVATIWAVRALARSEGAGRWPALLVGCAVAFGAFRTMQLTHLQMQATWMLPISVLWLRQALTAPRVWSRPALGFVLLMAGMFGLSVYHSFMLLPVLVLTGGWVVYRTPSAQRLPLVLRLLLLGVVSIIVALPSLWPYVVVQQSTAASRAVVELANWSAPVHAWFAVPPSHPLWPRLLGEAVLGRPELTLAPGVMLTFGCGALLLLERNRLRSVWVAIAMVGVVLASGTALRVWDGDTGIGLPFAGLLARLPGYSALRVPARWGWVVVCALAPLAALGWHAMSTRVRWWWIVAVVCLVLDLSWPRMSYLTVPQRTTAPGVVAWLADSGDVRTVLELPLKPQVESVVQADRLWWQTIHGQRSVTGYSGLAPATHVLLARDAAHLPRPDVLARLRALGVERVVVYRGTPDGAAQAAAVAACETCTVRYDAADALVVDLPPDALREQPLQSGQSLWLSADARLPDLVALGQLHAWQRAGVVVRGAARERFYPDLPALTGLPDAWLLGATEEPESVGVTPQDAVLQAAGAVRYARPAGLVAADAVGYPAGTVTLKADAQGQVTANGTVIAQTAREQILVVFDAAVLTPQRIGAMTVPAGAQVVRVPLRRGSEATLRWDPTQAALVRVRVFDRVVDVPALQSIPVRIDARVDGPALVLHGLVGVVQLQGIEDASGKAVTHPVPIDTTRLAADVLPALAAGHYQVVVLAPHGQRLVVANLWIDGSGWRWQAIPVPLTLVY